MIAVLLAVLVVSAVAGEILVTRGMKLAGEIDDFRPLPFARSLWRALRGGWLPAGVAAMAISFFALLALLSAADASFVIPATAVTYVLNTLGARLFLNERVNATRWAGALLVTAGVALLAL